MSERASEFDKHQRNVLNDTTDLSVLSGLAMRHQVALNKTYEAWKRFAAIPNDPVAPELQQRLEIMSQAGAAEALIAFSVEPSNMAYGINAIKVDPDTLAELPDSSAQVGLVGGLVHGGRPTEDFTPADLSFAVERLTEQNQAGLIYGLLIDTVTL
jgi:hypothetical protein